MEIQNQLPPDCRLDFYHQGLNQKFHSFTLFHTFFSDKSCNLTLSLKSVSSETQNVRMILIYLQIQTNFPVFFGLVFRHRDFTRCFHTIEELFG